MGSDVTCSSPSRQELIEDGGGILIAIASRCEDDLTDWRDLPSDGLDR